MSEPIAFELPTDGMDAILPEADEPSLFGGEPPSGGIVAAPGRPDSGYRVLARKYRPSTFDDLIGQDAMVTTLSNAFATNRIPQAWMLTGVRGVGKTTTARILARALNYEPMEGAVAGPTIRMPTLGRHCESIMASRHVDVMEMDAASHTGVDNIRQITDAVRYGPLQARYKVYIIDEVHMLSTPAFNAFLKTLEEPPPHAKFVFATTEIRKVPVTILSRCQRFDLRRVEADTLIVHLARICAAEAVAAEPEALAVIARASEGSVRDALSLLDQAVAHGAGTVTAGAVRDMLGLADGGRIIDLFEAVMRGDVPASFAHLRSGYESGADPAQILVDLSAFTHLVTRIKLVPEAARDAALTQDERVRGADFALRLSVRALARAWQILSKAAPEVAGSQRPLAAAEMAIVRLAYAADLPTPDEALRALRDGGLAGPRSAALPSLTARQETATPLGASPIPNESSPPQPHPEVLGQGSSLEGGLGASWSSPSRPSEFLLGPAEDRTRGRGLQDESANHGPVTRDEPVNYGAASQTQLATVRIPPRAEATPEPAGITLRRFEDVLALAGEKRELALKGALERDVRLVRFEEGRIEFALAENGSTTLPNELSRALNGWTGRRWMVVLSSEPGDATVEERRKLQRDERRSGAESHPLVRSVLASFPGAEIVDVRDRAPPEPMPAASVAPLVEGDVLPDDTPNDN